MSDIPMNASTLDPYKVLAVPHGATDEEIRSAYRKLALQRHPDKAAIASRDTAHIEFQELSFAYGILSDPSRRARYDRTGSTEESALDDDDFDWSDFFALQFKEISGEIIDEFKRTYQGSPQEREDVLMAYSKAKGDLDMVFETIECSNPLEDEPRFRIYIDDAIRTREVEGYAIYLRETKGKQEKRRITAEKEAKEAEESARELGVYDQLFGNKKGKGKAKKGGEEDTAALAALIKSRAGRMDSVIAAMEAKYAPKSTKKKKKETGGTLEDVSGDKRKTKPTGGVSQKKKIAKPTTLLTDDVSDASLETKRGNGNKKETATKRTASGNLDSGPERLTRKRARVA